MVGESLQQRPVVVVPSHLKKKQVKTNYNYNLEAARWKACKPTGAVTFNADGLSSTGGLPGHIYIL